MTESPFNLVPPLVKVARLEEFLINHNLNVIHNREHKFYEVLREDLMSNKEIRELLPSFVRDCLTITAFNTEMRGKCGGNHEKDRCVHEEFKILIRHLIEKDWYPSDDIFTEESVKLDPDFIKNEWDKALKRRQTDPNGAITAARALLESIMKRILSDMKVNYRKDEKLPILYKKVAECLDLAPNEKSEKAVEEILESLSVMAGGIGALRNQMSDAHGGAPAASPHHAALAVNAAGVLSSFLIGVYFEMRKGKDGQ